MNRKDVPSLVFILLIFAGIWVYINFGISEYSLAYIISGSMEPTYYRGDLIIMKKVKASEVRVGDVIVFKSPLNPRTLILHRVVGIKFIDGKYFFLTKGDNPRTNLNIDVWGWVPENNLIGKLVYRVPALGTIAEILSNNYVRYSLIILLSVLLIFSFINGEESEESTKKSRKINLVRFSKSIFIIALISVGSVVAVILADEVDYSVKVDKILYMNDISSSGISYVSVILSITSQNYWTSVIKEVDIGLYMSLNESKPISSTRWTITYSFYGTKKISICLLINSEYLEKLINGNYTEAYLKIRILASTLLLHTKMLEVLVFI